MSILYRWAQRRTGNNPTIKMVYQKYWLGPKKSRNARQKNKKYLKGRILRSVGISPLTFLRIKSRPKSWGGLFFSLFFLFFFFGQTFGKKSLSFPYVWTGRIGRGLPPTGVFLQYAATSSRLYVVNHVNCLEDNSKHRWEVPLLVSFFASF